MTIALQDNRRRRALTLIECITYCALFFMISGLAFAAYYHMDEQSRALNRNVDQISAAMHAGERWRADLRLATQPPQIENGSAIRITQKNGEVRYTFRDNAIWRQNTVQASPLLVLGRVKSSSMKSDQRQRVTAWRWELELQTRRTEASVRPLFSFIGVAGTEAKQ